MLLIDTMEMICQINGIYHASRVIDSFVLVSVDQDKG
jgi:hypothetical protein